MAASSPNGQMQFWIDGQPFSGVLLGTNDGGEMQFWGDGAPYPYIFPATVAPPATATGATMLMMGV